MSPASANIHLQMATSPTTPQPGSGRTYGGQTADQRRVQRREQFVDAGLELFGTHGLRATTIRGVIRQTGLAERYFYESFSTLEELLLAVYERIVEGLTAATLEALSTAGPDPRDQARAGLTAFVRAATADPRASRVLLFEVVSAGESLQRRRREVREAFADVIAQRMPELPAGIDRGMMGLALVGAIVELVSDYTAAALDTDLDGVIRHLVALFDQVVAFGSGGD
jgi:AcrR family transcriptional regulator